MKSNGCYEQQPLSIWNLDVSSFLFILSLWLPSMGEILGCSEFIIFKVWLATSEIMLLLDF